MFYFLIDGITFCLAHRCKTSTNSRLGVVRRGFFCVRICKSSNKDPVVQLISCLLCTLPLVSAGVNKVVLEGHLVRLCRAPGSVRVLKINNFLYCKFRSYTLKRKQELDLFDRQKTVLFLHKRKKILFFFKRTQHE